MVRRGKQDEGGQGSLKALSLNGWGVRMSRVHRLRVCPGRLQALNIEHGIPLNEGFNNRKQGCGLA